MSTLIRNDRLRAQKLLEEQLSEPRRALGGTDDVPTRLGIGKDRGSLCERLGLPLDRAEALSGAPATPSSCAARARRVGAG